MTDQPTRREEHEVDKHPRLRAVERVTLTRVDVAEGAGVAPDDPVRIVSYWHDDEGALLWVSDPWQEKRKVWWNPKETS